MYKALVRGAGAVIFAACIALGVLATHPFGSALAQGNSNSCYLKLYNETPQSVRAVTIGTSRIRRSVVLSDLEAALNLPSGSAANLAHAGVSPNFDYGPKALRCALWSFD